MSIYFVGAVTRVCSVTTGPCGVSKAQLPDCARQDLTVQCFVGAVTRVCLFTIRQCSIFRLSDNRKIFIILKYFVSIMNKYR